MTVTVTVTHEHAQADVDKFICKYIQFMHVYLHQGMHSRIRIICSVGTLNKPIFLRAHTYLHAYTHTGMYVFLHTHMYACFYSAVGSCIYTCICMNQLSSCIHTLISCVWFRFLGEHEGLGIPLERLKAVFEKVSVYIYVYIH